MNTLIKTILFSFLFCMCGCLNVMIHTQNEISTIYEPTKIVFNDCVCVWWNSKSSNHPIETTIVKITYPFWIVDFPCEFVFDTLTLPYDLYRKNNHTKREIINNNYERSLEQFIKENY